MKKNLLLFLVFLPIFLFAEDSLTKETIDSKKQSEISDTIKIQIPVVTIQNNIPETKTDYLFAIIPLITLILGFVLNKCYDSYTSNKKLKDVGSQWIVNFIQLENPLKNQILIMEEYIPLNGENNFEITDPSFNLILDCDVFKTLDNNTLIPYFNKGKNKLNYKDSVILAGSLQNTVKIIEQNSTLYKEQINIMKNKISTNISLFNPVFNDFKNSFSQYWDFVNNSSIENKKILEEATKMYDLMKIHVLPFLESGEIDLFKLGDEFIKPFFEATVEDRENQKIKEINRLLSECDLHIKAIKMEKKYFRIILEKVLESYRIQLDTISKITSSQKIISS